MHYKMTMLYHTKLAAATLETKFGSYILCLKTVRGNEKTYYESVEHRSRLHTKCYLTLKNNFIERPFRYIITGLNTLVIACRSVSS